MKVSIAYRLDEEEIARIAFNAIRKLFPVSYRHTAENENGIRHYYIVLKENLFTVYKDPNEKPF